MPPDHARCCPAKLELELELIQPHKAQKPVLRGEVLNKLKNRRTGPFLIMPINLNRVHESIQNNAKCLTFVCHKPPQGPRGARCK